MAQLGEPARARELLRRAAAAFEPGEAVARARCVVAEAEIALATRALGWSPRALDAARAVLEARGDRANALHARLVAIRRLLLIGRVAEAERALVELELRGVPPSLVAIAELAAADVALRSLRTRVGRSALGRALEAARQAGIPSLLAEVEQALRSVEAPAARSTRSGAETTMRLDDVEALLGSDDLVIDACRRAVRSGAVVVSLARKPVLFALARALAEASPDGVTRESLIERAFGARRVNESHRARLRVEIGRLRRAVATMARVEATKAGFALSPVRGGVVVLAPPIEGEEAALLALLADGEAWSTSALALALGESQRTVQRALAELEATGRVRATGGSRARRWLTPPLSGFATTLLLPGALPVGY